MATELASEPRVEPAPPRPRRTRRRAWPAITGFVVLLLTAAIGGTGLGVAAYAPLVTGERAVFPGTLLSGTLGRDGGRTVAAVAYEQDGTVAFAFTLANRGRVGLTVTAITGVEGILLRRDEVRIGPEGDLRAGFEQAEAFHPFRLDHGRQRLVWIRARFGGCELVRPGRTADLAAVTVGFRVLGVSRAQHLALPAILRVTTRPAPDVAGALARTRADCPVRIPRAVEGPLAMSVAITPEEIVLRGSGRPQGRCLLTVHASGDGDPARIEVGPIEQGVEHRVPLAWLRRSEPIRAQQVASMDAACDDEPPASVVF